MTFSVLKSTASNELQSSGKPSSGAASDATAEASEGNVFSNLFSSFTGDKTGSAESAKKLDNNLTAKDNEESKASGLFSGLFAGNTAEESAIGESTIDGKITAESSSDKEFVVDPKVINAKTVSQDAALIDDETVNATATASGKTNESGSDLLSRLDKSAQLLKSPTVEPAEDEADLNAKSSATQMSPVTEQTLSAKNKQGAVSLGDMVNQQALKVTAITSKSANESSTELLAGTAVAKSTDKALVNGNALPLINVPLTDKQVVGQLSAKSVNGAAEVKMNQNGGKIAGLNSIAEESNSELVADELAALVLTPIAMETNAKTVQNASSQTELSMSQLADKTTQTAAGGYSLDGKTANTKVDSQAGLYVAGSVAGTVDEKLSENMSEATSLDTEQVDFAQTLESIRRQEQPDQIQRQQVRPQNLTEAEQQVLDKRVNINNASASSELNEKIALMAGKDIQTATIRLDPSEMGSMNIKLSFQNDQVNVIIQAQNHQSRDLLEQQLPRLREMLQQQGIALGDTQVQADTGGQQQSAFQQSGQSNQSNNAGQQQAGEKVSNNATNHAIDSQTEVPMNSEYWQDSAKGVDFYA